VISKIITNAYLIRRGQMAYVAIALITSLLVMLPSSRE
jgi:hypothetical protein